MKTKMSLFIICILFCFSATQALADARFIESIKNCTPYDGTFIHPLTGEQMRRKIYGMQNNKCVYKERMPGNMVMECNYPRNMLSEVSKFYYNGEHATSTETDVSIGAGGKSSATYYVNGKKIDNILQECMDSGICTFKQN